MPGRLNRIFTAPVFENEEKTRIAQFMFNFSWIAIGIVLLLILSRIFLQTDRTNISLIVFVLTIVVLLRAFTGLRTAES